MRFIPTEDLKTGMLVGRDIINTTHQAMLTKSTLLTDKYIAYLQEKGYMGVYVTDSISADIEPDETVDQKVFLAGVEAVKDDNVDSMMDVAGGIVDNILSKDRVCTDLLDLRSFDDYTYHHSVNVAVYSTIVGRAMGLKESELNQLCQAGLCHDLGKSRVPSEILNKPGRLTDEEFAIMKQHSKFSYDILMENPQVSAVVKQAVLFHHENENGSGYPFGKDSKDIPLLAKIVHAVDVYDALTSKRPYKDPYEPADAFEYLNNGKEILFATKIIDYITRVIPAYPVGIDVYLSNGEKGLVISHTEDILRPVIRMYEDEREVDLSKDPAYREVVIKCSGVLSSSAYEGKIESWNEERSAVRAAKRTVLLVDDTIKTINQIKGALEKEYNLVVVENGVSAINYIKEKGIPDLIIIDVDIPMMDGVTVVKKIRESGHTNLPVIFLTAVNDKETIVKCRLLGAADYILKPASDVYMQERVFYALQLNKGLTQRVEAKKS